MRKLSWNDIPPLVLADEQRDLTDIQKEERTRTALHEAGHIVVGHRFGAPCLNAVVHVPGKQPKTTMSMRGADGRATVVANDPKVNAMVCLAGLLVEFVFSFDDLENGYDKAALRAGQDLFELHEETRNYSYDDARALFLDTLKTIAYNWPAIDGAAAYLLAFGNSGGEVPTKKLIGLRNLLDEPGWQCRDPLIPLPWQYYDPPVPLIRAEMQ